MNLPVAVGIGLCLGASLHAVRAGGRPRRFYGLKPLTTGLILGAAFLAPSSAARSWILGGLGFSLIGDICLLFAGEAAFMGGLGSFLIAHLAFIAAFTQGLPWGWPPAWTLLLGVYALGMAWVLWPRTGSLRVPVLIYSAVLLTMALAAARAHQVNPVATSAWGLAGALSFVVSDSILAADRFVRHHPRAQVAILLTYWIALIGLVRFIQG